MVIQSYRDLDVWQKSMDVTVIVYGLTKQFPKEELYGLTSQMRRAAVSIPSNIAEGRAKRTTRDFMRFIHIAYGAIAELETQLMLSEKLGYASSGELEPVFEDLQQIGRMLNGLLSSLEKRLTAA